MHIKEQIIEELKTTGWKVQGKTAEKLVHSFSQSGTLSDGSRVVRLSIDECGRWFERLDGWGNVQKDVDLRNFENSPKAAIEAVLS